MQVQGFPLDPPVLAQLVEVCVAAPAWDLALQLCNAALVAQVGVAEWESPTRLLPCRQASSPSLTLWPLHLLLTTPGRLLRPPV